MRWGIAINLTKCVGDYACVIACKTEHNLPLAGTDPCVYYITK